MSRVRTVRIYDEPVSHNGEGLRAGGVFKIYTMKRNRHLSGRLDMYVYTHKYIYI